MSTEALRLVAIGLVGSMNGFVWGYMFACWLFRRALRQAHRNQVGP